MPSRKKKQYRPKPAPKPRLGGLTDLTWTGHLTRGTDGITGRLLDTHGWAFTLAVTEHHGGTHLVLQATAVQIGDELGPWCDDGLRSSFMDCTERVSPDVIRVPVPGVLQLQDGAWAGWLGATAEGGGVTITATRDAPGRLVLRGLG